jgi:hypothetical protein
VTRAVLVHGNPETGAIWEPMVAVLAHPDVLTLSPPGFGAPVSEGFGATADEYAAWLVSELAKEDAQVDLVGHDWAVATSYESRSCVIVGPTRGHAWSASAARLELHRVAIEAGVRRRFAPHQLRHAHAVELLHEGIALPLIQRQLGHAYLSTTGTYLQGISSEEIISAVHARRAPTIHASAGLAP